MKSLEFKPSDESDVVTRVLLMVHSAIDKNFANAASAPKRFSKTEFSDSLADTDLNANPIPGIDPSTLEGDITQAVTRERSLTRTPQESPAVTSPPISMTTFPPESNPPQSLTPKTMDPTQVSDNFVRTSSGFGTPIKSENTHFLRKFLILCLIITIIIYLCWRWIEQHLISSSTQFFS